MKPIFTFSFLLFILIMENSRVKASAVNATDSLALVDLYNSTNGDEWTHHTNWLTQAPVCSWYGIQITNSRVTSIDVSTNNLQGVLPLCIGNLTALQHLYLYNNALAGSLPSSVGNLVNLYDCLLSDNHFSGAIPSSIGKLVSLRQLDLARNTFRHSIPLSIGNLTNAEYINLSGNQLTGAIPHSTGMLTEVKIFELADNLLSGSIPPAIGEMTSLQYLYLQDNKLSGSLPSSIGNLHNLAFLYADNNKLSGTITDDISNLTNLQLLSLSNNGFSGAIPSSLGRLTNLNYLYLNNNNLSGTIPYSLAQLSNLQYLYLDHNHLSQGDDRNPLLPLNVSLHGDISYNNFTFDGLAFIAAHYPFIGYSPQALLSIRNYNSILFLHAGGTPSKNDYIWFKQEDMSYTIIHSDSSFRPSSAGHYFAWVRNTDAPQLLLYTDTFEYSMPADKMIATLPSLINHTFQVYPNPAKDAIHIRLNGTATVVLTDANGTPLLSKIMNDNDVIDVSRFSSGTYYLQNRTTGESLQVMVIH